MKCHSKKTAYSVERIADSKRKLNPKRCTLNAKKAFSLIEVVAAVGILALICSSVLTVYSRCMTSAVDSTLRRQAFEVARENMEELLASDSVTEMVEFGSSDRFGEIQWQSTVETFYEPITARMWVRAICSAEYTDAAGSAQTVELTNWLTNVTKQQLLQIIEQEQEEQQRRLAAATGQDETGKQDQQDQQEKRKAQAPGDEPRPSFEERDEPDRLTENPLGLPDGYEDWSIDEIIEWLKDNGLL